MNHQNVPIPMERASKMETYDMSYVFDKLLYDQKIDETDVPELEKEFKKFMLLAGQKIYPIAMISPLVDEVWHQFILFTKHYRDFCMDTIGFFVGHMPDTPKTLYRLSPVRISETPIKIIWRATCDLV